MVEKLLDVCDFQGGTQPPKDEWVSEPKDGYIRMLQIRDYTQGDEKFIEYVLDNGKLHKCTEEDIMLSRYGYIGQAFTGLAGAYNVALVKVIKKKPVHNPYLLYYFKSGYFQHHLLDNVGARATIPGFNKSELKNAVINIPNQEKQESISDKLRRIEGIIALRQQELQKFEKLIKARFVEMFGTYPGNEKGWDTGTVRDLVTEVRYGSSRKAADGDSGKYPYLRMNNITYGGELDLTDTKTIDVPDEELDKCTVRRGDLLFNRTNSKELVGKTCVYNRDEMMVLAGFVVRVRLNDRALPEFVSVFLNTDFSKQMLLNMCKAAIGQANINAQELQNIGIYIPPIDLQKEFVSFKAQVDKSKVAVQASLDKAKLLFDSLMQEYFG